MISSHQARSTSTRPTQGFARRSAGCVLAVAASALLSGCAVIAVVDTAASLAVGTAGLVGDAAIGTARVVGKAAGAAADAMLPSKKP